MLILCTVVRRKAVLHPMAHFATNKVRLYTRLNILAYATGFMLAFLGTAYFQWPVGNDSWFEDRIVQGV